MSSRKQKAELLTYGYVKENYNHGTPMVIHKLIELFYDKYYHWKIHKDGMKRFLAAKDKIYAPSSFIVNDIEFKCKLYPNGWNEYFKGMVQICVEVTKIPSDIESFVISADIGCDTISRNDKFVRRWWKTGQYIGTVMGKLSNYKDTKQIDFYCMIDILEIKYKDKDDYKMKLKMNTHTEYEWKIDDTSDIVTMRKSEKLPFLVSDNFDNNNWSIMVYLKGGAIESLEQFWIGLVLLRWPVGISVIDTTYSITVRSESGKIYGGDLKPCKIEWQSGEKTLAPFEGRMNLDCSSVDLDKWLKEKWIKICVEIEITGIYINDKLIEKENWKVHGFVV